MAYAYRPSTIPSSVDNWDYLASTTLSNFQRKLVDNTFNKTPLLDFLKGSIQFKAGYSIVVPLMTAESPAASTMSYDPYDSIDSSTAEDTAGITAAEYRWRYNLGILAINGDERHRNSGEQAILDLLRIKTDQLSLTLASDYNTMLYADPAGGSKDPQGLAAIVGTGNPTRANLGGIDASTNAFWRSTVEDTTEALALARMSNLNNTLRVFGEKPDRIFTTQALWEKYESLLQPQLRYSDAKVADAGFENLLFKTTPVVWDPDCTASTVYFLNSKHLNIVAQPGMFMKTSPFFTRPDRDQENRYAQITSYFELVTDMRRAHGKLSNKS